MRLHAFAVLCHRWFVSIYCFFSASLKRKKEKRKRQLVVDQTKELTNEAIRDQLADYSELVGPMDMAPPTRELMHWKEQGGADKLLGQPCSTLVAPHIKEVIRETNLPPSNVDKPLY